MTHYTKANEQFRQDIELKNAIFHKLEYDYEAYVRSAEHLQKVYDYAVVDRRQVQVLLHKAVWYREFLKKILSEYPEKDTYIGNEAAYMTLDQAIAVKEKYRDSVE